MKLGDHIDLPAEAVSRTIGILGQKGSGKTYGAMKLAELMLEAGAQIACLDPTGVWWGLKAEGRGPGFPILVMGGTHGDIPLAPTAGAVVADFLVNSGQSVVLDLSAFHTNAEQTRFVTDFAERLYRAKSDVRTSLHLMLDEADSFAPQRPMPGEQRMLGALEAIVRRGRSRGLGMTMITQRPAVLNKNVLSQVDLLVAMRVVGQHDHKALADWTAIVGTREQQRDFMEALPILPTGRAFFWSPSWLGIFTQSAIKARRTFDSSRTPEPGAKPPTPKLAKLDIDKLSKEILASAESAKANDPKMLHAEIARLKGEIAQLHHARPEPVEKRVEVPVLDGAQVKHLEDRLGALWDQTTTLCGTLEKTMAALQRATAAIQGTKISPALSTVPRPPVKRQPDPRAVGATSGTAPAGAGDSLSKCERAILTALAQHFPKSIPKRTVAAVSQYSITSSSFANALSTLRTKGYAEGSDPIHITAAGLERLGHFEPLPTGEEAIRYWASTLSKCEGAMLTVLLDADGHCLSKEQIAERTGYSLTSSSFANALSALRTRQLVEGRDPIQLMIP